jgi:hypothetical protein
LRGFYISLQFHFLQYYDELRDPRIYGYESAFHMIRFRLNEEFYRIKQHIKDSKMIAKRDEIEEKYKNRAIIKRRLMNHYIVYENRFPVTFPEIQKINTDYAELQWALRRRDNQC